LKRASFAKIACRGVEPFVEAFHKCSV